MNSLRLISCIAAPFLFGHALAQQAAPKFIFGNADVHEARPSDATRGGGFVPGARFEARGFSMLDLVATAYGISDRDAIIGGPSWLATDKFDIIATIPADAPMAARQPMLQALLAERFHLVVHNSTKPMPAYALVAGKKLLLKESSGDKPAECKSNREKLMAVFTCTNMTVAQFAQAVNRADREYFNHPLRDETGLTGTYDFAVRWTARGWLGLSAPGEERSDITAFDALEKQLGLKVESRQDPAPVIVIDRVDRKPTENAAGVSESLSAPAVTEFEVAEIRLHKAGTPPNASMRNNRIEMFGVTLRTLIGQAYDVKGEQLVGGPKWIDAEQFDLIAKTNAVTPWENMQLLLRKLIEERFLLTFHKADQPIAVYALTVNKRGSKLKDADPTNRSDCKRTRASGSNQLFMWTMSCQNTTMAQLVDRFHTDAYGYVTLPGVDLTGLTGAFDFVLTWSPVDRTSGRVGSQSSGTGEQSAPSGELTFFEALDKQLGLKLQQQKYPMPVMVIDHAELPANN